MNAEEIFQALKDARPTQDRFGSDWSIDKSQAMQNNGRRDLNVVPFSFDGRSPQSQGDNAFTGIENITIGNIAAGAEATTGVTCLGVDINTSYACSVNAVTPLPAGITISKLVPGNGTVEMTLFNNTAGTINVGNRTYYSRAQPLF